MNIQIWDKESTFRGFDKDMWFTLHPESQYKVLVYAEYVGICYLEDIKEMGYTGQTDIEIIQKYVTDYVNHLNSIGNKEYNPYTELNTKITEFQEEGRQNNEINSLAIAEVIEKQEKDKIELSTAIVELSEMLISQDETI